MNIVGWSKVTEFSVGGLMWVGFSKRQPHRLLCISSQYASLVDCNTGDIVECEAEYDEISCVALTSCLPDEVVDIYGIYGGSPLLHTNAGDEISITKQEERFGNKTVIRARVFFNTLKFIMIMVFTPVLLVLMTITLFWRMTQVLLC